MSEAAWEAEREIDRVGDIDKERATPKKQGDCKRPLHNKEGALYTNQNVNGDMWLDPIKIPIILKLTEYWQ